VAAPLFTKAELLAWIKKFDDWDDQYRKDKTTDHKTKWAQREAIERAQKAETNRKVRLRAEEFLDALTVIAGSRGTIYIGLPQCFELSDSKEMREALAKYDTPEARRALYTILRALSEVPKSWAMSAFIRFLRGNGKQKGAKYHGAGTFAVEYGWKGQEVENVCRILTDGHNPYSQVLVSYADVAEEIRTMDPEYQVVDQAVEYRARFEFVRADRDVEFLQQLCGMLEKRGLGPVPTPVDREPKKKHVPKEFKTGDIIRERTLRDLPLPAHVRIPIEKETVPGQWTPSTVEAVIVQIGTSGRVASLIVNPKSGEAHRHVESMLEYKSFLDGATYLGPWKGKTNDKSIRLGFRFRKPEKEPKAA
jgi:hypothetical protein